MRRGPWTFRGGLNGGAVAVGIVMKAVSLGSNRRFAMSALRPIVLGIVVSGLMTNGVRADSITWPNWMAWLVGRNTANGGGSVNLGNFSGPIVAAPQPILTQPQPQPVSPVASSPPAQPIIANGPVNSGLNASPMSNANAPVVANSSSAMVSPPVASSSGTVDAYINLSVGPYPAQNAITSGNAQAWYDSPQIASFFGGHQPTAQQQQSFDNTILQRVQQSFSQSGVAVTLTDNSSIPALHTVSVVSNATSATLPSAIGMTQVGGAGFSFINVSASSAQTLDQLEWVVAHNISHELMLAFGVPENFDTTGQFLDAKMASYSMMVSPNATFSPAASQALTQAIASLGATTSSNQFGAQGFGGSPVPEPTTLAIWVLAATALFITRRIGSRQASA
jgi:hypothetical protein